MAKLSDIRSWLDSKRDYNTGLTLFLKFSSDNTLRELLSIEQQPWRLQYELKKFLSSPVKSVPRKATVDPKPSIEVEKKSKVGRKKTQPHDLLVLPKELHPYRLEARETFLEAQRLHLELAEHGDKMHHKSRESMCRKIVHLMDQNNNLWDSINHYLSTGGIEQIQSTEDRFRQMGEAQLLNTRSNLRSNRSKAKRNIKKCKAELSVSQTHDHKVEWSRKLRKYESKLLTIEAELRTISRIFNGKN